MNKVFGRLQNDLAIFKSVLTRTACDMQYTDESTFTADANFVVQ